MANQFIAIQKGASGRFNSDFTVGTSSASTLDFDFRMANPTADGKTPLRKDAILALKNIPWCIESNQGNQYPPL